MYVTTSKVNHFGQYALYLSYLLVCLYCTDGKLRTLLVASATNHGGLMNPPLQPLNSISRHDFMATDPLDTLCQKTSPIKTTTVVRSKTLNDTNDALGGHIIRSPLHR